MRHSLTNLAMLRRLHWATWCAMLITAIPLLLIMVPGEITWPPFPAETAWQKSLQDLDRRTQNYISLSRDASVQIDPFLHDSDLYEHGWPYPYLARSVVLDKSAPRYRSPMGGHEGIGWIRADTWPLLANLRIVRWWALGADIAIGVLVVGSVGGMVEWRIRTGTSKWRFRLFDAFLVIAAIGLFLSPFAYHTHVKRLEVLVLTTAEQNGIEAKQEYHGPIWLRKLIGNESFLRNMYHIDSMTIDPSDNWREEFTQFEKCPYLTEVTIQHWLPLGAIPIMRKNQNLKEIVFPNLQIADMLRTEGNDDNTPFLAKHIACLESLKLTSVSLNGVGYQARHVRQLAEFPSMRRIYLSHTLTSEEELQTLRTEYPHIKFVSLTYDSGKRLLWTEPRIDLPIELPNAQ